MIRKLPATPARPQHRSSRALWDACYVGNQPAEELSPQAREELIKKLWQLGWADWHIAEHTRLTEYTVARIRSRLRLTANTV